MLFIVLLLFLFLDFLVLPLQLAFLLLFGWIAYLGRVVPHMTVNPEIAIEAVMALALALYGLHRILCWWTKQRGGEPTPWRFGWTLKITAMVLLLFATSISAVGIVHQIAWMFREGKVIEMMWGEKQAMEMSHLFQVGEGMRRYADDHGGQFPKQLEELIPDYLPNHKRLFTRAADDDPPQPILYFSGRRMQDGPRMMILASPRLFETARGGKRCVVYANASGGVISEEEYQMQLRKQRLLPRKE